MDDMPKILLPVLRSVIDILVQMFSGICPLLTELLFKKVRAYVLLNVFQKIKSDSTRACSANCNEWI